MDDVCTYLKDNLGLGFAVESYSDASDWPVFLSHAADYYLCTAEDSSFIVASVPNGPALPSLKRIFNQAGKRTDLPIVLANESIDARQRKALVQQGIPFVVPGKQAYLPFLGFVATAKRENRRLGERLSPSSQAALVAIIANPSVKTAAELRDVSGLSTSSVSRALDELAARKLISKSKAGRSVVFAYDEEENALIKSAMPYLSTPVSRRFFVRKSKELNDFPDAGSSALAARSMLAYPAIVQKAVVGSALKELVLDPVLEGELDNSATLEIQVWSYEPLVAGLKAIDDVSLALSLADEHDERIAGELNSLFNKEDLWQ